jgi:hypothetical protein
MKFTTYQEVIDKIHAIDYSMGELRVLLENIAVAVKMNNKKDDFYPLEDASLKVRNNKFLEDILKDVVLAKYWTEYLRDHGHNPNISVLDIVRNK